MVVDLQSLHFLSACASAGNFGRAANSLGVQASTVSRRIARLEDELGLTVFERGHAGIRLTGGGKAVMVHVRRVLADLDAVASSARCNASGNVGTIRLGIRMPPIGRPLQPLFESWRKSYPLVALSLYELSDRDILAGIEERRLDVAVLPKHTLWPHAVAEPICREPLMLAFPKGYRLAKCKTLTWKSLRRETFLVQGWDESQTAREFYASFLGSGARYQSHAASKQSIMALVGAGFGVTLVTKSQAEVRFPGVVFKRIAEKNAQLEMDLVWVPENKEAVIGRFVSFMRDEAHSRHLV